MAMQKELRFSAAAVPNSKRNSFMGHEGLLEYRCICGFFVSKGQMVHDCPMKPGHALAAVATERLEGPQVKQNGRGRKSVRTAKVGAGRSHRTRRAMPLIR